MKNLLFVITLLLTTILFSQNKSAIRGTIIDSAINNEPMLFANIELRGSDKNYQTNLHGNFEILDIEPGSHTLVISYTGYKTEEINVVVEENTVSQIETVLSQMQINFDDVAGMDQVSTTDKSKQQ